MEMPGRKWQGIADVYRFGMNDQEKEKEIYAGAMSAEYWMYDSRIGRRWNVDPVVDPAISPYATFDNNPIFYSDPSGAEPKEGGGGGEGEGSGGEGDPVKNKGGSVIGKPNDPLVYPEVEIAIPKNGGIPSASASTGGNGGVATGGKSTNPNEGGDMGSKAERIVKLSIDINVGIISNMFDRFTNTGAYGSNESGVGLKNYSNAKFMADMKELVEMFGKIKTNISSFSKAPSSKGEGLKKGQKEGEKEFHKRDETGQENKPKISKVDADTIVNAGTIQHNDYTADTIKNTYNTNDFKKKGFDAKLKSQTIGGVNNPNVK